MPLPPHIDSLSREWVEAVPSEPFRLEVSSAIIAFLAYGPRQQAQFVGTGVVIATAAGRDAVVLTAKHVLTDGAARVQKPSPLHASSALPEFISPRRSQPSVGHGDLRGVWSGQEGADLCIVHHAQYNDSTDIAACLVSLQDVAPAAAKINCLGFDTNPPHVGEVVYLLSSKSLEVTEENYNPNTRGQTLRIGKNVAVRVGTVTGVYPASYRQYAWPCFTTSIPAEAGMSGGAVCRSGVGSTLAVCGIVSADCSDHGALSDFYTQGCSVVAMVWPSVGLSVPVNIPPASDADYHTILELLQSGQIPDVAGTAREFSIERQVNGDYFLKRASR